VTPAQEARAAAAEDEVEWVARAMHASGPPRPIPWDKLCDQGVIDEWRELAARACSAVDSWPGRAVSLDPTAGRVGRVDLHGEVLDELIDIHQSPDWGDPAGAESLRSRIGFLVDQLVEPLIDPTVPVPDEVGHCVVVDVDGTPGTGRSPWPRPR
jgi:hypothetical protein